MCKLTHDIRLEDTHTHTQPDIHLNDSSWVLNPSHDLISVSGFDGKTVCLINQASYLFELFIFKILL